jgi:hypothetical protein
MNKNKFQLILVPLLFFIASGTVSAQQRVIEESLVYDDPTVAKPGKWLLGASLDYYNYNAQGQAYDSNNNKYPSSQNFSQPGVSAWAGYGDFSLLAAYKQGSGSTNVPAANTGWKTDNKELEINLRYLIMPLSTKYFVPYVLAGYLRAVDTDTLTNVFINGVQEVNTTTSKGPGIGAGGIIPITEKYGFRADYRQYKGTSSTVSPVQAFNGSVDVQFIRITGTAYYNITDNVNIQLGARTQYVQNRPRSTATGGYLSLGYTFQ